MANAIVWGKPEAGNSRVRIDKREVVSAKSRCGPLLYRKLMLGLMMAVVANVAMTASVAINKVETANPWESERGKITVDYSLVGLDPRYMYKVAFDVTADGKTAGVTNDATKLTEGVQPQKTIETAAIFGKEIIDKDAKVKISLVAVKPPMFEYMVIDLMSSPNYLVSYEELTTEDANAKFNADEYKTGKLVMRKVAAGLSYYYKPERDSYDPSALLADDDKIPVTRDYWIGLFQVTAAQYDKVMSGASAAMTPKNWISYETIRGTSTETSEPTTESFLGKLTARCKDAAGNAVTGFDLPTDAQWEIACRAGTATKFSCGNSLSADYAVYETYSKPEDVGTKKPNPWGLYDMHGNVNEWCRDVFCSSAYMATTAEEFCSVTEPGSSAIGRVMRGGGYSDKAEDCASSSSFFGAHFGYGFAIVGFRLSRTVPASRK